MKSFILFISLLFALAGHAQSNEKSVYRFRCFEVNIKEDDDNSRVKESDWEKRNILIVVDMEKQKIHTYTEKEVDIDLTDKGSVDKSDENVTTIGYGGVDQEGERCYVTIYLFNNSNNQHIATLLVHYIKGKYTLAYRLKKDD